MRSAALGIALVVFCVTLVGQDHAPTLAQCRADEVVWSSIFNGTLTEANSAIAKLSYNQLLNRAIELGDCATVDPEKKSEYEMLHFLYVAEKASRLEQFLIRHDLLERFIDEDRQGKR